MERVVERCAGLDVHRDTVVANVRVPEEPPEGITQTFGTTWPDLLALRDWLTAYQVTLIGMESTGVYWKPVYYAVEDAAECWLLNARHMHNVPGRKTDVADAAWIAQLIQHGLVKPSFVPPRDIREARMFTRYRKAQIDERGREAQRLDKVLQDAGVKLSSVATDILGVSGRAMMAALTEGTRDPRVLSDLAKGKLRSKIPLLRRALDGRFGHVHGVLVAEILAKLEYLDEAIARLGEEIEAVLAPHLAQLQLLVTIPGIGLRSAQMLTGEIGTDMSRFGSAKALASWAGVCPGNWESAGKSRTGRSRKGPKWLGAALHECAMAAIRSKGSYLHAQYQRIKPRRGHARALKAVEHSIVVAIYHMLARNQPYHDLGADYFTRRNSPDRQAAHHLAKLRDLGYQITAEPPAA
ncbi:IS110 family transposase [Streptomyces sp. NPDC005820]|uniref:IS110 family transposase n=1 Tax=Streptomyces sp. NPDC005820 TaxID=3157069 RepID=UPI0033EB9B8F